MFSWVVVLIPKLDLATCGVGNAIGFGPLVTNFSPVVANLATTISSLFIFSFPIKVALCSLEAKNRYKWRERASIKKERKKQKQKKTVILISRVAFHLPLSFLFRTSFHLKMPQNVFKHSPLSSFRQQRGKAVVIVPKEVEE